MADQTSTDRNARRDDFQKDPAPEATNFEHPGAAGARATVPGAGVVDAGRVASGAAGKGTDPDAGARTQRAPADPQAPGQVEPEGTAGAAAREVADPNYSAASRPPSDRQAGSSMNPDLTAGAETAGGGARRAGSVRDLMTTSVEVASPDTDLYYVARMMAERDVGAIPVVDSTDTMRPVGILTDRDIVVRVIAKNQSPAELRAGDVMTPSAVTVRADADVNECVRLMAEHQLRRVIVVDGSERVVGIVAQADVATAARYDQAATVVTEVSRPS